MLKPWQSWEQFNCKFRVLKSEAFSQGEVVLWKDLHYGARFGNGCNRQLRERKLTYAPSAKWMSTKTNGFSKGSCSYGSDAGRCFLYQPADGSLSGDAFLCVEDATKGSFHKVHQYKCVKVKISQEVLEKERSKAAGPDDLFIMYCTSEVTADLCMLPNSAIVDATCWKAHYGSFAARAFFIESIPSPYINTSSEAQLEFLDSVSKITSTRIIQKRPFTSLEDAHVKTKIPATILTQFKFNTETHE